jgi:hypothetical protein
MEGENEEVMEVFDDSDFLTEEIEDTNDDTSKEDEEESDEIEATDEDKEDADLDVTDDEDIIKDEEEKDTTPKPFKFKGKLNHQDIEEDIPYDEAVALIQMGKDYNRVKDQVNTYKNDPRLSFVENLAKQVNMTPEQYINFVNDQQYQSEIDDLVDTGMRADDAKELVDSRRQKQQGPQTQTQEQKELIDFVDYYAKINGKQFNPDTDTLPDEVWKANAGGTPLKVAYMEHLVQQKQEQQKQLQKQDEQKKQNEEAKKKAPVKGVSNSGPGKSPKKDPLLDGLFED